MQFLLIPVLGLAPGLLWLWLIYRGNKNRPEPKGHVIRTFIFGAIATIPVSIIETVLVLPYLFAHLQNLQSYAISGFNNMSLAQTAYMSFIVAGFTEELSKFLVVRTTIYKSPYYDEPIDGLVYSSAAALGFASLENVGYLLSYGWQTALIRAPITTLAHVTFSALWGYPLALKKLKKKNSTLLLWLGLLGAMAGHGLFDFLAFQQNGTLKNLPILIALIVLFGGLIAFFIYLIKRGQKTSPFNGMNAELRIACPNCQARNPDYAVFCPACGAKLSENRDGMHAYCSKCGAELSKGESFCTACGSRIIKKPGSTNEHRR
jgi:RsiW-degrading membrane proteinase PrsW (M82 family)/RNA polymerase subunit RPABC4/transcription elongation factor Spt4